MIKIIRAKLHGLRVTGADITYHGSITLDPEHCAAAGIYPLEFVNIWNKNTGARISTYVIYGKPGSRCCILNGAAARTCQMGDEVIIAATELIEPEDLSKKRPEGFDVYGRQRDFGNYAIPRRRRRKTALRLLYRQAEVTLLRLCPSPAACGGEGGVPRSGEGKVAFL